MHPDTLTNGCDQPIEANPQQQKCLESSSEKADLLTKIDSCIEDAQYNINRAIDRLASERAKIIILEKAKYEVVNGKIGEGATEILSETVLRF